MKYFFLAYAVIAIMVVGVFKYRGHIFHEAPIRIFPDMDDQDKLKAQKASDFFKDGQGARQPVSHTNPRGFNENGNENLGGIPELEFSGGTGYYFTGIINDYYGSGFPTELNVKAEDSVASVAFIKRGEERFLVSCAICHGRSGNGMGMTGEYGVPGIANLMLKTSDIYPDGRFFETITKGKGMMSGYGYNIPVRDRWAIVAYVRAMQLARKAPYDLVKDSFEQAKASGKVK
jgi:mono/diheme cytochrome c family protein